jgi:hypothetical protein
MAMGVGADGLYPFDPVVWAFVPTAQVWMGRMRTNAYRRPQSWPQLRRKASSDYFCYHCLRKPSYLRSLREAVEEPGPY